MINAKSMNNKVCACIRVVLRIDSTEHSSFYDILEPHGSAVKLNT